MRDIHNNDRGFLVASLLIAVIGVLTIALIVTDSVVFNFSSVRQERFLINSQMTADAGLDYGISQLNQDGNWTGTGGEVTLFSDSEFNTTYEITVTDDAMTGNKLLSSTGRTYRGSESTPSAETETIAELYSVGGTSGVYSLVTGVGGLTMQNSSKIIDGEVRVNGSIDMDNSAQIGLTTNFLDVYVSHQSCPVGGGATYPQICSSGEPIDIANTAHIYGDVCAKNQTDGSGMSDGGLNASCSGVSPTAPTPDPLPDHDRATQISNVNNTISGDYSCSATTTQTISANTRITGDMSITGRCKIVIEGDLWVEGNLTLRNRAELQVPDTINLGDTVDGSYPTIMVDGSGGALFRNISKLLGNSSDVGFQVITYWSEASCSPDCADVTGQDLYDSRDQTTIQLLQSSKAETSILYSRWSQVDLNNGGDVGAVVGQTVLLRNSASITFGASVGGGGSSPEFWLVKGYRRN